MNREEFNQYWANKGHQATSTDYKAYQLGQQMNENTVQGQQNKIANQIRNAPPAGGSGGSKSPTVADHHPTHPYQSWAEYSGTYASMGMGVTQKDYQHYLRTQGITTQGDHDISGQTIHKNEQGSSSISKGEPDHVHDQKQGSSTGKGIPKTGPPKGVKPPTPTPPPTPAPPPEPAKAGAKAGTPPLPTQRTQPYTYPYKNLPFDPTRPPPETFDTFYGTDYKEKLTRWSRDNWDRYQKKQPLIPKPLPPKATMIRERAFMTSKTKTYDEVLKNTLEKDIKFIKAKDIKRTPFSKQIPYYIEVKGVRQKGLYNIKGEKYDETGPKITDLGFMNLTEEHDIYTDTPENIKSQAYSRMFDLIGAGGSWLSAGAKVAGVGGTWATKIARASQRTLARNAARLRNLKNSGRYGQMSTLVTGTSREATTGARASGVSGGGLIQRNAGRLASGGPASAGRPPARIGELPMSGGATSALTGGGAEALQNAGL